MVYWIRESLETKELYRQEWDRGEKMLGIIYIVFIFLLGRELAPRTVCTRPWLLLPFSFGTGSLILGWITYFTAFFASVCLGAESPLFYGNLLTMTGGAAFLGKRYFSRVRERGIGLGNLRDCRTKLAREKGEILFFLMLAAFISWTMFYVFHEKDGILYAGFSVFGDYAPHTAMIRSFSWGNNFPTQYPHFGGEDVKYHFMFQFLAGNLEYLGMRLDIAYNLISILALTGFLMMLYMLAVRITGRKGAGFLGILFFFFRSGTAFFRFFYEHVQAGDLLEVLKNNTAFIGYTPNEDWGLWNYNVYLNQRHLAFGLLIVSLALWFYLEWVEETADSSSKGAGWLMERFFTRKAWWVRKPETALLLGLMLGMTSFWNGAAVIGGLLILAGFGLFSDGKLDYALTAGTAVLFSFLQSKIFIQGEAMEVSFYWGFLAEDKSAAGTAWYIFSMSGIYFAGLLVLLFFLKRKERMVLSSFFLPAVFAFFVSLTPDINVNHKYIMISYAFLTMFWAWAVVSLWRKCLAGRAGALLLSLCLTVTGVYDFVVILKDNDADHRVSVPLYSSLSQWISETLDKGDLMLTPEYSINEVTMAGEMLYCGWPYYAWSAGYDTNARAAAAVQIYTTEDQDTLRTLVAQENITYILFEEGMEFEQETCREDVIARTYPLVYRSEDGRIRIYET